MSAAARYTPGLRDRRGLLAKVHVAKKQLGLDDDTYRDLVELVTGERSSGACNTAQLVDLVAELEKRGFKPVALNGGKRTSAPKKAGARRRADHPVARKARALWISLHQLGEIDNPSEQALEAFAKRQLGVEQLQWADQGQGYKLIEALKRMAERAGWSQAGTLDEIKDRLELLLKARA